MVGLGTGELFVKPIALTSPDIGLLIKTAKSCFIDKICGVVPSPCECGEHLNKELQNLLGTQQDNFDPIGIESKNNKVKALAIYVGMLVLALTESVSQNGISFDNV